MAHDIPHEQVAVQLVGPDELVVNTAKQVDRPGPFGILAKVEAVGLCFSDLKLLKQFRDHTRKSDVLEGIDLSILPEVPSYCPNDAAVVPGHEAVATIVAVGDRVSRHRPGERVLVQTDYRWLRTASSNAAFGYNFEGALQQYVLFDERIIVDPATDESFLIPVQDATLGSSALALVEPWACVESSYCTPERHTIKAGGRLLVVAEHSREIIGLDRSFAAEGSPVACTACCKGTRHHEELQRLGIPVTFVPSLGELGDAAFDDIVYFGSRKDAVELLDDRLAAGGILNVVLGGAPLGAPVSIGVGRVHYALTRLIGTTLSDAHESYGTVPETGEIRDDDRIAVIGAAGPMGQMHVIRLLCSGKQDIRVVATDLDDARLAALATKVAPLTHPESAGVELVNTANRPLTGPFGYVVIMVPAAALVAQAVAMSTPGTLINLFAGIPPSVKQELDLDAYITNRCYLFGTSGSRLDDMKTVLTKLAAGQLDTNCSVDAVSGMAGAIDGIEAIKDRRLSGKIVVYPQLPEMGLVSLAELEQEHAAVAAALTGGLWTKQAEDALLGR